MTLDTTAPEPDEWRNRCARRLAEHDEALTAAEAMAVAEDVYAFERTRAMSPEAAADLVASEMRRPDRGRIERRMAPR